MTRRASPKTKIEIVPGRTGTVHTNVPDWVGLSGCSNGAHSLYVKYAMHLNVKRGDPYVWPGKENLGVLMNVARGDAIDPYVDELVNLGAVEIGTSGTMPAYNIYKIHFTPPEGYTGPVTLQEFYERQDQEIKRRKEVQAEKTRRSRAKKKKAADQEEGEEKPAVTGNTGLQDDDRPVTGETRELVPGDTGELVTRNTGVEQKEPELKEVEQPPPPSSDAGQIPGPAKAPEQEEGKKISADQVETHARNLLKHVLAGMPSHRHPDGGKQRTLIRRIADAMRSGWAIAELLHILGKSYDNAGDVYAVMTSRLNTDITGRPPRAGTIRTVPKQPCRIPACDKGLVSIQRGTRELIVQCPTCHPEPYGRQIKTFIARGMDEQTLGEIVAHLQPGSSATARL